MGKRAHSRVDFQSFQRPRTASPKIHSVLYALMKSPDRFHDALE
jgi:hypothetical protein